MLKRIKFQARRSEWTSNRATCHTTSVFFCSLDLAYSINTAFNFDANNGKTKEYGRMDKHCLDLTMQNYNWETNAQTRRLVESNVTGHKNAQNPISGRNKEIF